MTFRFAHLPSRALIRIAGADAKDFLQGLISNDIEKVAPGQAIYAALLSAQGKLQFEFIALSDLHGGYLLDIEAARADELVRKLKLYRLRAKVTIEPVELIVAAAFDGGGTAARLWMDRSAIWALDPRITNLGFRFCVTQEHFAKLLGEADFVTAGTESDYEAHRLALGVPEGVTELGDEKLFLLEANFEELHGVDFKKGCYVGQELTARMKHKTELKKRLLPFRVSAAPEPGASLTSGERELGQVIGARGEIAFVLTRLDRLAEADAASLKIGEAPATLVRPPYLAGVA